VCPLLPREREALLIALSRNVHRPIAFTLYSHYICLPCTCLPNAKAVQLYNFSARSLSLEFLAQGEFNGVSVPKAPVRPTKQ